MQRCHIEEVAYGAFLGAPVGRYTVMDSSFVWCASPVLCGVFLWGEQTEVETSSILRIFDQCPPHMASSFDMVLDSRGVEDVRPAALELLFSWLVSRRSELVRRLRTQANVIREGPIGLLLTGLLPVAQWPPPYRLHYEPTDAFRSIVGDGGTDLCTELEAIALRVRGVSRELRIVRELIARRLDISIDEVSRALGMSSRSLQRLLRRDGTSFHNEVVSARFLLAQALLRSSEDKLAAISLRVGISERSLTQLFRSRTGLSPAQWRGQRKTGDARAHSDASVVWRRG